MEKLKELTPATVNYAFTVEIYNDSGNKEFVAKIKGHTPRLPQRGEGGDKMKDFPEEELIDSNEEKLIERCRARIVEVDGEILYDDSPSN